MTLTINAFPGCCGIRIISGFGGQDRQGHGKGMTDVDRLAQLTAKLKTTKDCATILVVLNEQQFKEFGDIPIKAGMELIIPGTWHPNHSSRIYTYSYTVMPDKGFGDPKYTMPERATPKTPAQLLASVALQLAEYAPAQRKPRKPPGAGWIDIPDDRIGPPAGVTRGDLLEAQYASGTTHRASDVKDYSWERGVDDPYRVIRYRKRAMGEMINIDLGQIDESGRLIQAPPRGSTIQYWVESAGPYITGSDMFQWTPAYLRKYGNFTKFRVIGDPIAT